MPIKHFRPLTPSQRFTSLNKHVGLSKNRPQKALTEPKHKTGGRNAYGRLTSRRMGGGHKQLYRIIDFKRDIFDIPAVVEAIEYDPNRSAHIALLAYTNGVKRYIPAPEGLKAGDRIVSANTATTNDFTVGNCFPLGLIPPPRGSTAWRWSPARAPRWPAPPASASSSWPSSTATPSSRCPPARSAW